jgi:hypothetical protein
MTPSNESAVLNFNGKLNARKLPIRGLTTVIPKDLEFYNKRLKIV